MMMICNIWIHDQNPVVVVLRLSQSDVLQNVMYLEVTLWVSNSTLNKIKFSDRSLSARLRVTRYLSYVRNESQSCQVLYATMNL